MASGYKYSVFECQVDSAQWVKLKDRLIKVSANWQGRVEHVGAKPSLDLDGSLVF